MVSYHMLSKINPSQPSPAVSMPKYIKILVREDCRGGKITWTTIIKKDMHEQDCHDGGKEFMSPSQVIGTKARLSRVESPSEDRLIYRSNIIYLYRTNFWPSLVHSLKKGLYVLISY